ncbi:FCD domain-containing protein, partial [Mesorhizobium sp. M0571]|uniref:FCD domain-containing protein n=1 Tax=Mesorhizobium sp. M0571 TaxID=2956960 RepID=UPI003334F570
VLILFLLWEVISLYKAAVPVLGARGLGRARPPPPPTTGGSLEVLDVHDFSGLDNRFHRLINEASPNRFIDDFYDIITFICHYHYQWNKQDEKQRNLAALHEHVAYIDALESHNSTRIEVACRAHLASARETLMRSLTGFDETNVNA